MSSAVTSFRQLQFLMNDNSVAVVASKVYLPEKIVVINSLIANSSRFFPVNFRDEKHVPFYYFRLIRKQLKLVAHHL